MSTTRNSIWQILDQFSLELPWLPKPVVEIEKNNLNCGDTLSGLFAMADLIMTGQFIFNFVQSVTVSHLVRPSQGNILH